MLDVEPNLWSKVLLQRPFQKSQNEAVRLIDSPHWLKFILPISSHMTILFGSFSNVLFPAVMA